MEAMQEIYRSDTLRALLNRGAPAGSDAPPAMVTFEGRGVERRKAAGGLFAGSLADKLGIDIVHVVPTAADWYHYPDMDDCLAAVRPLMAETTLAYGSSMGAYAVARFADRLGVARGLCLSPQYSINQAVVPFEQRWQTFASRITFQHDDSIAPRRSKLWILTDMAMPDEARHARLIAESGPHEIIDVAHAGHPVGPPLNEVKQLLPICTAFLEGRESAEDFREMANLCQDQSGTVLVRRLQFARRNERRPLIEKIKALPRLTPKQQLGFGLILLRMGREAEAEAQLAPLLSPPRNPRFANRYRQVCEKRGLVPHLVQ